MRRGFWSKHDLYFLQNSFYFMFLQTINLKGEKYLLKGHINVKSTEDLPEIIPLDILDTQETVIDGTIARLASTETDQSRAVVYEYSFWAKYGQKLIFVPWDSRYVCC